MRRLARWQERHGEGDNFAGRRAFEQHPDNWMTAEQRAEAMHRDMIARNQGQTIDSQQMGMGNRYLGSGPMVDSTPRMSEASTAPMMRGV